MTWADTIERIVQERKRIFSTIGALVGITTVTIAILLMSKDNLHFTLSTTLTLSVKTTAHLDSDCNQEGWCIELIKGEYKKVGEHRQTTTKGSPQLISNGIPTVPF